MTTEERAKWLHKIISEPVRPLILEDCTLEYRNSLEKLARHIEKEILGARIDAMKVMAEQSNYMLDVYDLIDLQNNFIVSIKKMEAEKAKLENGLAKQ